MGWLLKDDRIRQVFEDQFEPDGSGYIYRKGMKGPPIKVTADERDVFIADFVRTTRLGMWLMVIGMLGLIALLVAMDLGPETGIGQFAFYGCIAIPMVIWLLAYYRAWNKPTRDLEDRLVLGEPLTREEARNAFIRRTSYKEFLAYAAFSVFLFWRIAGSHDMRHGWWRLAPVILVIVLGAFAWRIFQKWQLERSDPL